MVIMTLTHGTRKLPSWTSAGPRSLIVSGHAANYPALWLHLTSSGENIRRIAVFAAPSKLYLSF